MNDIVTWASLAGAVGSVSAIIGFWTRYSDGLTKADAKAGAAEKAAEEAKKEVKEALEKIAILAAQFALYREQVLEKFVNRDTLREVEERLMDAIERLGDRFDRSLEQRGPHKS